MYEIYGPNRIIVIICIGYARRLNFVGKSSDLHVHDQPMLMLQGKALAVPGLMASQVGESIWFRVQDGN
jgi:hypothetical protein